MNSDNEQTCICSNKRKYKDLFGILYVTISYMVNLNNDDNLIMKISLIYQHWS